MKTFSEFLKESDADDEKDTFDFGTIQRDLAAGSEEAEYLLKVVGTALADCVQRYLQSLAPEKRITCVVRIDE